MATDRGIKPLFYGMMLLGTDSSGVKGYPPLIAILGVAQGGQLKINNEGPIGGPKGALKLGEWGPVG